MHNLYYPVYKNLENEVIDLAYKIHFADDQLDVYSIKIAELLVRCCVEIEAISKDLYLSNGGTIKNDENGKEIHLYFDNDCLDFLEKKWILSKKIVYTSSSNFYFTKDENKALTPLNKANKMGTSGAKWKQAYQAVKHNRSQNSKKANVKNLIHAMAALYLLNIYYKDEEPKHIGTNTNRKNFITATDSSLFSVKKAFVLFDTIDETFDESVYIERNIDTSERDCTLQRDEPCSTEEKQNYEKIGDFFFHLPRERVLNKNKETSPKNYLYSKLQTFE